VSTDLTKPNDVIEAIRSGNVPDLGDPADVAMRVVEEILRAPDVEAAFDTGGSVATAKLVGEEITIVDVRLMPGTIEDAALPVYVLLDCADQNGEKLLVNSGAARVIGQAVYAKMHDLLPMKVRVVEIAKGRTGQSAPLGLAIV
jgi:hypothetical protein